VLGVKEKRHTLRRALRAFADRRAYRRNLLPIGDRRQLDDASVVLKNGGMPSTHSVFFTPGPY
jgi:hypothetical protein